MSVMANIRWARKAPYVLLPNGNVDEAAHHVLLALSTFSDARGACRPSLDTLADAAIQTPRTTAQKLRVLVDAGLIKAAGTYGKTGVTVWVLMLGITRSEEDTRFEERQKRARVLSARRQKRWRDKHRVTLSSGVTRDASEERYVTPSHSVTHSAITPSNSVSNAVELRNVTLFDGVSNAPMAVTTAGHSPNRAIEEPIEEPGRATLSPSARRNRSSEYTAGFETFWRAYERKGTKANAAREWQKAIKRAAPETIMAAIPLYFASRPDEQFRKDAERWLKGDGWESNFTAPAASGSGRQAYRNPHDQSVYDAPIA